VPSSTSTWPPFASFVSQSDIIDWGRSRTWSQSSSATHSTTNFHKIRCSTTNDVTSSRLTDLSTTRERHENVYLDLVHVEGRVHNLAVALPLVAVGEHTRPLPRRRATCGLISFLGYSPVRSESTCFTTFTSAMHTFARAPVQYTNVRPAYTCIHLNRSKQKSRAQQYKATTWNRT
jgi:hypothetical protein